MSEKTLGEVAYEAARQVTHCGQPWEKANHAKWQAAADAIAAPLLARIAELEGEVKYLESGKATFAAHFKTLNQHNDALSAEVARLIPLVPHPGDGTCDCCGAAPAVAIPTALCDSCLADNNTAYQRGVVEERERCARVVDAEADEAEFKMLACASHDPKREQYEAAMVALEHAVKAIRSASPAVDVTSDKGGEI